jgi:Ca2+/Na+ antiporter
VLVSPLIFPGFDWSLEKEALLVVLVIFTSLFSLFAFFEIFLDELLFGVALFFLYLIFLIELEDSFTGGEFNV